MSEMVERAVKAAEDYLETDNAFFDREESIVDGCVDLRKLVMAIIASMRDPTEEMYEAGRNKGTIDCWQDMIDEALKASSPSSRTPSE